MKKEAQENAEKGVDTSIPEGFGMPQKDADTFKKVTLIKKKRTAEELTATDDTESRTQLENT